MKLYVILFSFIFNLIKVTNKKSCSKDFFNNVEIKSTIPIKSDSRVLSKIPFKGLRIHLDYSSIEKNKEFKKLYEYLKEKIMPKVESFYEKILQVKRISELLKFDHFNCVNEEIPERYTRIGEGIDADLIIFVRIDSTGYFINNSIEAAATHCAIHFENFRPLAGVIIFNPNLIGNDFNIKSVDDSTTNYFTWLAIHEVAHIIGFNSKMYENYIDENGKKLGIEKVIGYRKYKGRQISYIKSPKVLEKAKLHFNCTSLSGVPLEFHGGEGTAGAHWSKKFMNTDFMIGDSYGDLSISEITLAVFEDSGWYKVDYSLANIFSWGKNKGCNFFDEDIPCLISEKITSANKSKKHLKEIASNNSKIISNKLIETDILNFFNKKLSLNSIKNNVKIDSKVKGNKIDDEYENFSVNYHSNFKNEFCEGLNVNRCSINHKFKGTCKGVYLKSNLPSDIQYFENPKLGGYDFLTDRCPIVIENKENNNEDNNLSQYLNSSCRFKNKLPSKIHNNQVIEKYCENCICVENSLSATKKMILKSEELLELKEKIIEDESLIKKDSEYKHEIPIDKKDVEIISSLDELEKSNSSNSYNTSCIEVTCVKNDLYLLINLSNVQYKLHCKNQGYYSIKDIDGIIKCPDPELICNFKYKCEFGCVD